MRLKRFVGSALALVTLSSVTGCAIGFGANTSMQKPSGNGRYATAGDLEIRDATVVANPKDPSKGTLLVTIYNGGEADDALIGASSLEVASQANQSIALPAMQSIRIGFNSPIQIGLSSVSGALVPGNVVPVTFHFANTQSVPMELLVNTNDGIFEGVKVS